MPQIIDKGKKLLEMTQPGFEQGYLSGAPIGAEGFAGLQSFQRGETPAYAIQSPAGQRAAREHFATHGDPAVQNRVRQATLDAVARANTKNPEMLGKFGQPMTPNDWIASKHGTAQPQLAGGAMNVRTPAAGKPRQTREGALAIIAQRRAQAAQQRGVNPHGIAFNQMQQAAGYEQNQKMMLDQQEEAAKLAEKSKPKIGDLKGVLPPEDGELATDEGFDNWHARALKRWEAVQAGQPTYTPQPAPQTPYDMAKEAWGGMSPQAPNHPDNMPANPEGLAMPMTKEEYDALPPGTRYIHPSDKRTRVKA